MTKLLYDGHIRPNTLPICFFFFFFFFGGWGGWGGGGVLFCADWTICS